MKVKNVEFSEGKNSLEAADGFWGGNNWHLLVKESLEYNKVRNSLEAAVSFWVGNYWHLVKESWKYSHEFNDDEDDNDFPCFYCLYHHHNSSTATEVITSQQSDTGGGVWWPGDDLVCHVLSSQDRTEDQGQSWPAGGISRSFVHRQFEKMASLESLPTHLFPKLHQISCSLRWRVGMAWVWTGQ